MERCLRPLRKRHHGWEGKPATTMCRRCLRSFKTVKSFPDVESRAGSSLPRLLVCRYEGFGGQLWGFGVQVWVTEL
jgi:hypothetical protein